MSLEEQLKQRSKDIVVGILKLESDRMDRPQGRSKIEGEVYDEVITMIKDKYIERS